MFTGFNWGNAFGLGHMMTLQWTSDFDVEHSKALSGNYTADLWNNHSVTVFGAYSEIVSVPNGGIEQEGTSWQLGLNYDIPLQPIGQRYTHRVQLGFDYKSSDNNLEIAIPPFVIPISDNLTHVVQFRGKYSGTLTDSWGATSLGLQVTMSPGGLASENDDDAFDASRAFANADYIYGNLDIFRNNNLRGFLEGWNWTLRGEWQVANGNLLGSEQFSGGGSQSVRGYEESEVVGDNALFFSQALQLPVMQPAVDLFDGKFRDSLRLFAFHDYARTWNVDKLAGEEPFNVQSIGAGLNYQFSTYASLRFAYGWQLKDSGTSSTGDNSRAHVSFQISY
jgi:hemolysin activation/secretion protein